MELLRLYYTLDSFLEEYVLYLTLTKNKRVAARLLQLDKKGHKNRHFRMLESADITLVAAAGFEPTTFGL